MASLLMISIRFRLVSQRSPIILVISPVSGFSASRPVRNFFEKFPHPESFKLLILLISSLESLFENASEILSFIIEPPSEKSVSHLMISSTSPSVSFPEDKYSENIR